MSNTQTICGVVTVPAVPASNVGPFYSAPSTVAMRVLVRNLSGATIFLAFDSSDINGTLLTSKRFELPAGLSEVFILQPRQSIFAVTLGAGGRLCYTASEALPFREA
jgi:hypothetical protein